MAAALIPLILQYALQYGIPAARDIITVLNKKDPTPEDWTNAFNNSEKNALAFLKQTENVVATPI